jgi:Flp pilus assembly pilin Flp
MGKLADLMHALSRDDRGVAVMEYGMIITTISAVIIGLMTLGGSMNDCLRTVGMLLTAVTGHS